MFASTSAIFGLKYQVSKLGLSFGDAVACVLTPFLYTLPYSLELWQPSWGRRRSTVSLWVRVHCGSRTRYGPTIECGSWGATISAHQI